MTQQLCTVFQFCTSCRCYCKRKTKTLRYSRTNTERDRERESREKRTGVSAMPFSVCNSEEAVVLTIAVQCICIL